MKIPLSSGTPLLCLITPGYLTDNYPHFASDGLLKIVRSAVENKVSLVQIREKNLSAKNLFQLVTHAVDITKGSGTKVIVNDRADIAAAVGADGVQLTEVSLPVHVVRASFPDLLIGASAHSIRSIKNAAAQGADFVLFGPVFPTPGKENGQGLGSLMNACESVPGFPILGVGGIDEANYRRVLEAGAAGFGAIRSLNNVESQRSITAALVKDGS